MSTPDQPDYAHIAALETELQLPHAAVPPVMLTKDAIKAVADLPTEDVEVPEWGGMVRVRGLSGADRDAYFASMAVMGKGGNVVGSDFSHATGKLVSLCVVDGNGDPMFSAIDVGWLGQKSAVALGRVFEAASRLSGLEEADIEALGKDSNPTLNGDSTSTSPSGSG